MVTPRHPVLDRVHDVFVFFPEESFFVPGVVGDVFTVCEGPEDDSGTTEAELFDVLNGVLVAEVFFLFLTVHRVR